MGVVLPQRRTPVPRPAVLRFAEATATEASADEAAAAADDAAAAAAAAWRAASWRAAWLSRLRHPLGLLETGQLREQRSARRSSRSLTAWR